MTKKLIIIDDSLTQLNVLKSLFSSKGWEVCGVQNAKIGYEMIFDFAPDIIITDAIMPMMGGSQLIKAIRDNEKISKIPIIVYSILNEINAKYYVNEELNEFFLRKNNNQAELFELAEKITNKFPLSEEYKKEILKIGLENYKVKQNQETQDQKPNETLDSEKEISYFSEFDENKLINEFKSNFNNTTNENKIFPKIFSFLHSNLNYDLAIVSIYSFEKKEKVSYFDIKDIILSPILKDAILEKHQTKTSIMYKKYAPNLKTITNESEFLSKFGFEIECKEKNVINVEFYSFEKLKWEQETQLLETTKNLLDNFFKTIFIQKLSDNQLKEELGNKYFTFFNKFKTIKTTQDAFFAIIQISNFQELMLELNHEEMDILSSKISQKIVSYLEENEQIYRNDIDEYNIIIFAKDNKQALNRLNHIINSIEEMDFDEQIAEISIGASSCNFEDGFNISQAQKNARISLEKTTSQEKVVLNDK